MHVAHRSPTRDPHSRHSREVAVSSDFTTTSSSRASAGQFGDRTSMNAYPSDQVSSSINWTPRSRIIALIWLNTVRGVWNSTTEDSSPRVRVASRSPAPWSTDTSSPALTWIPKLERRWFALYRRSLSENFAGTVNPSHDVTNPVTVACGSSFISRSKSVREPNFSVTRFLKTSRVPSIVRPPSTSPLWISIAMSSDVRRAGGAGAGFSTALAGGFAAGGPPRLAGGGGAGFFSPLFQNLKGIPTPS